MSRNLFIRVSAATYSEDGVLRDWPRLAALVRPDNPFPVLPKNPAPLGVMDLVRELPEIQPLLENTDQREALAPFAPRLARLLEMMENALGDRDVHKAHALTNEIEDTLDEAERAQPKP